MTERRDIHGVTRDLDLPDPEPAPDDGQAEGAELAALRKPSAWRGASRGALDYWPQAETLLRIVDELTVQFRAERQAFRACSRERDELRACIERTKETLVGNAETIAKIAGERNELRAKLAAVPGSTLTLMHRWDAETSLRKEVQAKLAEAEKGHREEFEQIQNVLRVTTENMKAADAENARLLEQNDQLHDVGAMLEIQQAENARLREAVGETLRIIGAVTYPNLTKKLRAALVKP